MVSVIASSSVDRGFEPWSGQTKKYKIGICCFSAKHTVLHHRGDLIAGDISILYLLMINRT